MGKSVLAALAASAIATSCMVAACSSSDDGGAGGNIDPNAEAGSGDEGSSGDGGGGADAADASRRDGNTYLDGALADEGGSVEPPSVRMIGRFATDGSFAYPGSKLIARFNGTDATVKLTQTNGYSGGNSWFNVTVDGVAQPALEVTGVSVDYAVATNLTAGIHTVEMEKRSEGNLGVVKYEGFTYPNGGTLLSPPARLTRRIEILSDSTIDGFGVEGSRIATDANYCGPTGTMPIFNNAKKGAGEVAAAALNAESFLVAYSGKGIQLNEGMGDTLYFPSLYPRTLPDTPGSTWDFTSWVPDAVVLSLGGVDFDGQSAIPAGFNTAFGTFIDTIRSKYPSAWIFLTVWSQVKNDNIPTRTAMENSFTQIMAARPADTKLDMFVFPQAMVDVDETGCEYHGNATHEANMGALLAAEVKTKLGW